MYRCICDLVVVIVAFIHDEREIEVHCAAMGVKSLLYLHCNYFMNLFETFPFSFNSSLPTIKLKSGVKPLVIKAWISVPNSV